jgi:Tol biopolymer transport system component
LAIAGVAVIVVAVAAFFAGERMRGPLPPAAYHQLTFRLGTIRTARFAPDGQSIVYGALWEGSPIDIFITRPESPQSRSLGFSGSELLAISSAGEMAVSVGSHSHGADVQVGTLARASLNGGAPRQILENVQWADWSPDGANLAVVRDVAGRNRLEFPIGKVLYETSGWIGHPRISPKGDQIAFMDHPLLGDDSGTVAVIDLAGSRKVLASNFVTLQGLAWAPSGDEVVHRQPHGRDPCGLRRHSHWCRAPGDPRAGNLDASGYCT